MKEKKVKIRNKAGIHCRPASVILNTINVDYPDNTFTILAPGHDPTELNSILSLISLGLHFGDEVTLQVEGPDEEAVLEKMSELLEYEFDFPPRQ
jgi:phosphocarrier protein